MRALLVSAFAFNIIAPMSAFAADMPVKAPPAPAPVIYDWTGFYVGANAGVALGAATITSVEPTRAFPPALFSRLTPRARALLAEGNLAQIIN
jgi:hypothetical protein